MTSMKVGTTALRLTAARTPTPDLETLKNFVDSKDELALLEAGQEPNPQSLTHVGNHDGRPYDAPLREFYFDSNTTNVFVKSTPSGFGMGPGAITPRWFAAGPLCEGRQPPPRTREGQACELLGQLVKGIQARPYKNIRSEDGISNISLQEGRVVVHVDALFLGLERLQTDVKKHLDELGYGDLPILFELAPGALHGATSFEAPSNVTTVTTLRAVAFVSSFDLD